ncbi:MAG: NADH:ubiquinone reductase (Na(+)-transporting) subunit D [Fibrobacter sp.]|nr:NADH:ubiquinone reductase (Na(+)-transporting) subunit D [Fibrobacter sp.]
MAKSSNMEILKEGIWSNNPILFQVLGICSALAVTTQLKAATVMAISLTVVITLSNMIISAMRKVIPSSIRMIVELVVISTLVIVIDQVLQAFVYETSKALSVFVGLIITNCIVMGRAEAFALANPVIPSMFDGIANGLGYGVILILVAGARELLGAGKLLGFQVIPEAFYNMGYSDMGLMVLAPGAFFLIGLIFWGQREIVAHQGGK